MRKKLFISLFLLFGFSIVLAVYASYIHIKIADHHFCIPKKNVIEKSGLFDWIYEIPGLDKEVAGILIFISAEELAAGVPGYKIVDKRGVKLNSIGSIRYLSDEDREAGRHTTGLSDMWRKAGAYKYRHVEYDKKLKLYKVFSSSGPDSKRTWTLFSQYPDETRPVPDLYSFSVGGCRYGVEINDYEAPINCNLSFIGMNNIKITASISGENLHLYKEVREFMRSKINEWKNNCK